MSIYRLLIELVGKDKGATRALKSAQKETLGLERAAQKLQGGLAAAAGVAGMAYVGKQALDLVGDLFILGAQAQRTETAFRELARGAGGSADAILSAIKKASGGTVSEMDAMMAANKGMLLGLGANAEQWEKLTEIARVRGRAMGLSVTQALSDITVGLGRQSAMILDNLGITLDLERTYADYAATLGTTAKQLSEVEKKQALVNKVIEEGSKLIPAGGITPDALDTVEALASTWEEVKTEIGLAVAETGVLQQLFSELVLILKGERTTGFLPGRADDDIRNIKNLRGELATLEHDLAGMKEWPEVYDAADIAETEAQIAELEAELAGLIKNTDAATQAAAMQSDALKGLTTQGHNAAVALERLAAAQNKVYMDEAMRGGYVGQANLELMVAEEVAAEKLKLEEEAAEEAGKAWEKAMKEAAAAAERAWDDLKSTVAAALQPTSVTALDVQQTAMGTYVDKWDEDARRLDAIAARGFAELDAHPDWAGILGIPPEVLGGTEDALKEWARQQSDNFRNLLLPLGPEDVAAAVQRVRDYVQQQAQREANIEKIALAYQAEYGGTVEDARAAMGDTGAIGGIAADDVMAGFTDALEASSPAAQFASYFKDDMDTEEGNLLDLGMALWQKLEEGLLDEMEKGNLIQEFAALLAPWVELEIAKKRQYAAGSRPGP